MELSHPLPPDPIFCTAAAYALGWCRRTLAEAKAAGLCHSVLRGWYAHGPLPDAPAAQHLETVAATHLAYEGRLVTSGVSACLFHDLPVDDRDLDRVLVTRRTSDDGTPPCAHGTSSTRVLIRASCQPDDVIPGVPVLRPAAAVVEYALQSGLPAGVAAGDAALRSGVAKTADITAAIGRRAGRTGIRRVSMLPGLLDPLAENGGESKARLALVQVGFDVESQVWVETPTGWYRADWRVRGTATLIELDGVGKYLDEHDQLVTARVRRDRTRDRALEATGHGVVHLTMDDINARDTLRPLVVQHAGDALRRPTPAPLFGRTRPNGQEWGATG